ncbi:type II toxin-antitoxin system PemK/MazF family toxin [Streptomyces celluloflavus]|uniref:type II toxin-antitoxin system PemK/MazF family toxin n=1 Tax=Streptomyces celluloflavus TaxID=58344 RepID=UPI0036DB6378
MDTSVWLGVVAVVALALVATVVDGRGRSRRVRGGADPGAADGRTGPRPGEIWWARMPYEDPAGRGASREERCLVLSVRGECVLVAGITDRSGDARPGLIPLPAGAVGDDRDEPGFLAPDELRRIAVSGFRRRAGAADPALWDRVRHLAD